MNTKSILRAAALLAVLATLACSKDDAANPEPATPDTSGTTALFTITATMYDTPETRISATDDGTDKIELKWKTGDAIYVINGSGSGETRYRFGIGTISADGKTASFTAPEGYEGTPAYALHKSIVSSFNPANVTVDPYQYLSTAYSLSYDYPLFASYDPATRLLAFRPLFAVLKLNITLPAGASGTLSRLRIGSADGSKIFYSSGYDITSGEAVRSGATMIGGIKQTGSASFTGNTKQSVYLPVRPGTELSGQLLEVDLVVGNSVYTAMIKGAVLEAGKCYPLTLGVAKWTTRKIYEGGTGDEGTPYLIGNEINLRALARAVRAGEQYSSRYFKLTGDIYGIQTSSSEPWLPIGTNNGSFCGYFDGDGHTVGGTFHLSDKDGDNLALFGSIYSYSGYNISNLTLAGEVVYRSNTNSSGIYVGAIAGYSNGGISGCTHTGALTAENTVITSHVHAGGIVGHAFKDITGCTQGGGTITVNMPHALLRTGGIAGYFYPSSAAMHTCRSESNITATGKSNSTYAGALAGDNNGAIYGCSTFPGGLTITVNGTAQNPVKAVGFGSYTLPDCPDNHTAR